MGNCYLHLGNIKMVHARLTLVDNLLVHLAFQPSCVVDMEGSCVIDMEGSCVVDMEGSCVIDMEGSCVVDMEGSCVIDNIVKIVPLLILY